MSTLWTAASVTATNGSNLITVQSGEDIAAIRANSWIMVGYAHIMEIKRTFVTDSGVKTIELFDDWEFGPASGQRATVAPSLGEFKTLADDVRRLIQIGEEQVNTASVAPEPGSSVKRSENGTVKTAEPQSDADAVRLQDFAPVKQKGEGNEQAISSNSLAILRQKAMAKLERDAVFLGKFTEDRVVKSVGLSKVATSVADGITYTSPDGITGVAANGTIQTAGVNQPPIVYAPDTGECLGLQTAPGTTNFLVSSEDLRSGWPSYDSLVTLSSIASPIDGVNYSKIEAETTGEQTLLVAQYGTATVGDRVSFQFIVSKEYNNLRYIQTDTVSSNRSVFDIDTGKFLFLNGIVDYTKITELSNAWRVEMSFITDTENPRLGIQPKSVTAIGYNVDYIAGEYALVTAFQGEIGYPTPYQPTSASQVMRDASFTKSTGLSIPTDSVALYFEGRLPSVYNFPGEYKTIVNATNEDGSDRFSLDLRNSDGAMYPVVRSGGVTITDFKSNPYTGGDIKALLYLEGSNVKLYLNGELMWVATLTGAIKELTRVGVSVLASESVGSSNSLTCKKFIVSGTYFTDAEANALTTQEQ